MTPNSATKVVVENLAPEFDSLSLTERVTVGTFGLELLAKDQPSDDLEFINWLRSPCLEDLPYYDDVIKAVVEAIEAYD
ncbi:hypothetical protein LX32DRAFT_641757 [Colletotrichum zoysiae]|uniref:Uncharacterized protein n=1 Tax=Colletotrichum zoysiae TaxID=1216348 RepID=A0AAD9HCW2_9PEZI|nr:hypothetical protein LX32DRAFT_641757 [Colletotrichum zoysiae]